MMFLSLTHMSFLFAMSSVTVDSIVAITQGEHYLPPKAPVGVKSLHIHYKSIIQMASGDFLFFEGVVNCFWGVSLLVTLCWYTLPMTWFCPMRWWSSSEVLFMHLQWLIAIKLLFWLQENWVMRGIKTGVWIYPAYMHSPSDRFLFMLTLWMMVHLNHSTYSEQKNWFTLGQIFLGRHVAPQGTKLNPWEFSIGWPSIFHLYSPNSMNSFFVPQFIETFPYLNPPSDSDLWTLVLSH